jgi:hypothetical protein
VHALPGHHGRHGDLLGGGLRWHLPRNAEALQRRLYRFHDDLRAMCRWHAQLQRGLRPGYKRELLWRLVHPVSRAGRFGKHDLQQRDLRIHLRGGTASMHHELRCG